MLLSPNQYEFKNFFRDLISKYEETAGKIQTLMHEPTFEIFYETPIYELTKAQREAKYNMTEKEENEENLEMVLNEVVVEEKMPWPDVEFLFGEDESYQDIVAGIMKTVTYSINSVTTFAEVSLLLLKTLKINFHVLINLFLSRLIAAIVAW